MMLPSLLLPFVLLLASSPSPALARRSHGSRASTNPHLIAQSVKPNLRRMDLHSENKRLASVPAQLAPLARPRMDIVVARNREAVPPKMVEKRKVQRRQCKVRSSAKSTATASIVVSTTATSTSSPLPASTSSSSSSAAAQQSANPVLVAVPSVKTTSAATPTTTKVAATTTKAAATTTSPDPVATNDADWPTKTQAGDVPSATATSASDPYLLSASYALNNDANVLFTEARSGGQLTYYATGQTSCGSVYTDTSYTAAVSHLLYDSWPGATVNTNRNPICGPYTPGRLSLTSEVLVASSIGSVLIGGDGLLNCVVGEMCHIPLTATLTYNGKSVKVQIVDRCEGCAVEDIDVTPTVFEALTGDMGIGRVTSGFSWSFDKY